MTSQPCDPPDFDAEADFLERTPKHFLDPDPQDSTSCLVCADVNGYGVLHVAEPVDEPAESRLLSCSDCGHVRHQGKCWGAIPAYPTPKPCKCGGVA